MYKFNIGDEVYLKESAAMEFEIRLNNPVIGSDYECVGVVIEKDRNSKLNLRVKWSNGTQNVYKDKHLIGKNHNMKNCNINSIW